MLTDPSQRATAWTTLVDFCVDLMRRRSGTDRRGLQQVLEEVGAVVDPAHSYEADIARLRARSNATSQRLVHLATIPAGAVEVRIDRRKADKKRVIAAFVPKGADVLRFDELELVPGPGLNVG